MMHEHHNTHLGHNIGAHDCDDQLAIHSRVGRGIQGNSVSIDIFDDESGENKTILTCKEYDPVTQTYKEVWTSENINGGKLTCEVQKNFTTNPPTFKLRFDYSRPGRSEWTTETPAIPFFSTEPEPGTGPNFATLFLKDHSQKATDMFKEITIIPEGHSREEYDLPNPPGGSEKLSTTQPLFKGEPWSGALDLVEFDEFSKITGLNYNQLIQLIQGVSGVIISPIRADIKANNIIDYIDKLTLINGEYLTINGNTIDVNTATEQDIRDIFK